MVNNSSSSGSSNLYAGRISIYAWVVAVFWTALIGGSLAWYHRLSETQLLAISRVKAITAFERDRLFRQWISKQGGVYVRVGAKTPPNPLLSHVPERDVTTPSGVPLTLINATYMARQVSESEDAEQIKTLGLTRLTSFNPLNITNKPDAWEREGLKAFEKGTKEVSGIVQVNGRPYMRLMRVSMTTAPCLECHASQGYRVGDVRGGIGVSVPISDIQEATRPQMLGATRIHGLIWILGLGMISFGANRLTRNVQALVKSENAFHVQADLLEKEVAERKLAQVDLALKQRELEELNHSLEDLVAEEVAKNREKDQILLIQGRQAAMGEMIGNIAHQWRQPLNALAMLLVNIHDAYRFNELDEAYMDKSFADGNRLVQKMSTTINDFRNFFHPDKERVVFSAEQQLKGTIALVESSFNSANVRIDLQPCCDLKLLGFPNEYSQVLLNLFANAKDAIVLSGATAGRIEISLQEQDGYGCVTVRDNGGGILAENLDRIFEPYFSTKQLGTGIGLYMSKMIIERNMKGKITARNVDGGAEFLILTPLAVETGA
jgi:signal transduction histidine kinase